MQTVIGFLLGALVLILSVCTIAVRYLWWIILAVIGIHGLLQELPLVDVIWNLVSAGLIMIGVAIVGVIAGLFGLAAIK